MKKYLLLAVVFVLISCSTQNPTVSLNHFEQAQQLLKTKDFFHARDYTAAHIQQLSKYHILILEAGIANVFNKPAASNGRIEVLFRRFAGKLSGPARLDLLRLKQENHGRLFEYKKADAVTEEILLKYTTGLSQKELDDYKNTGAIWETLRNVPPQEIVKEGSTYIQMTRDRANLANLEVSTPSAKADFIFDTGANISTVTRSTAQKLDMKMLGGAIEVGSVTGAVVTAELAMCPQLKIGNTTVKNVIFLVFPDDALAFPQIDYQINGILGFPVIEALKEIQITKKDEFIIPHTFTDYTEQNIALDFLTPVININGEHYTFDTGATGTALYVKYLAKHKDEVISKYAETDIEFGGAGGMTVIRGYTIEFSPVINGKELKIENVQLYSENIGNDKSGYYYGNVGQDVIKQFDKITLNFESMFIRFD